MTLRTLLFCFTLLSAAFAMCSAQNPPQAASPTAAATPMAVHDPAMTQIRKTVAFIRLQCKDSDKKEHDVRGTGFFVSYPDQREGGEFVYLVTNRHVALCINDKGQAMEVESISLTLNRKSVSGEIVSQESSLNPHGNVKWYLPSDDSIDLAAFPIAPDVTQYDYLTIPVDLIAGSDLLKERQITEGEPVFFTGFFYQFPGTTRMEPIVRRGIIAMMPTDKVPFVGNHERVFLADMHVFGGNSGSPAFINLGGIHGSTINAAEDYKLLGVVNGILSEDENFNLKLTSTIQGHASANSGVSTIVPADELKVLLNSSDLQNLRDETVKNRLVAPK